jgi:hypothetical protein
MRDVEENRYNIKKTDSENWLPLDTEVTEAYLLHHVSL